MLRVYVLIATMSVVTVAGQLCLKQGVGAALRGVTNPGLLTTLQLSAANPLVLLGLSFSAVGASVWITVLSRAQLSFALPLASGLFYVLLLLSTRFLLGEPVPVIRWVGVGTILLGMGLVTVKA